MNPPEFTKLVGLILLLSVAWCYPARDVHGQNSRRSERFRQRVDQLIDEKLREQGIKPAPVCDDTTFVRRLTLDLIGKNPTSGEVVAFLRNDDPQKRDMLIDRLLRSPGCAVHLANTWSAWLLPEMQDLGAGPGRIGLHTWLRNRFADNLRYDRLVADLLVASGPANSGPGSFFISLEGKPEKIAAKTARVFLGVQLDCAECHDHPFDHWKQRDFWGFAAYFARLSADGMRAPGGTMEVIDRAEGEVKLPNTEEIIAPQALVSTGLSGLDSGTRRQQLTLWLTARENPYLARAAVNRCWSILFGRGLIEPIDDMRAIEMASHPELLRELSQEFAARQFDLHWLLRTLVATQAYQRATAPGMTAGSAPGTAEAADSAASEDTARSAAEVNSYASMPVKPLTALQLSTCLQQVARDVTGEESRAQADALAQQLGKLRGDSSAATLGIVQALVTLHSGQLAKVHQKDQSRLLQALTAPHLNSQQRIEWLFLSTLCRPPREEELTALLALEPDLPATSSSKSGSENVPDWQSDLLWALINTTEFAMTP